MIQEHCRIAIDTVEGNTPPVSIEVEMTDNTGEHRTSEGVTAAEHAIISIIATCYNLGMTGAEVLRPFAFALKMSYGADVETNIPPGSVH